MSVFEKLNGEQTLFHLNQTTIKTYFSDTRINSANTDQTRSKEIQVCRRIRNQEITKMDGAKILDISYKQMRTKYGKFEQVYFR